VINADNDISVDELEEGGPSIVVENGSAKTRNDTSMLEGAGQIDKLIDVSAGNLIEKLETPIEGTVTSTPIKDNISPYFVPEKVNPKANSGIKVLSNRKRRVSSEKENNVPRLKKQKDDGNFIDQDYNNTKEEPDNDDLEDQMEKMFESNSETSLQDENVSKEGSKKWKLKLNLNSRNDSKIDENLYVATCKGEPIDVEATIAKIEQKKLVLENPADQEEFKNNIESLIVRLKHEKKVVYRCAVCNKTLKLKVHIASHIEANHVRGVAHECSTCNSVFKTRATLKIHKTNMHENISSSEGTLQNRQ